MTISTQNATITVEGDGVNTVFGFDFEVPFQANGVSPAIQVLYLDAAGVITILPPSSYTVEGVGVSTGGTVTYAGPSAVPIALGTFLIINRALEYTQSVAFPAQGFKPQNVERALDDLEMQLQQVEGDVQSSLRYQRGFVVPLLANPSRWAGQYFVGDPITGYPIPQSGNITVSTSSLVFDSLTTAVGANIPAAATFFYTMGYASAGDRGSGLYKKATAQIAQINHVLNTVNGLYYEYVPEQRGVNCRAFGALGLTTAGDTAGIQLGVNVGTYYAGCPAYLPYGAYTTNDVISLGYGKTFNGSTFSQPMLDGDGPRYRGLSYMSGTQLTVTVYDRCAVNFQGARIARISNMAILGPLSAYIVANNLGNSSPPPVVDDSVRSAWIDPAVLATAPNLDSRYAPLAAIGVDCYAGVAPATHYPNVNYPAFLGGPAQYGAAFSSGVSIENVYVSGFTMAVANQPCDADGNGDYIKFQGWIEYCVDCWSVGNSQSRNFDTSGSVVQNVFDGYVNAQNGRQIGKFGCTQNNTSFARIINLLNCPQAAYAGPLAFNGIYAEDIWSLGTWGVNADTNLPLKFDNYQFLFTGQAAALPRGIPAYTLIASHNAPVLWGDGEMMSYPSIVQLGGDAQYHSFEGSSFRIDTRTRDCEKYAHNATAGGLILTPAAGGAIARPGLFNAKSTQYDIEAATVGAVKFQNRMPSQRSKPICAWVNTVQPTGTPGYDQAVPEMWNVLAKASVTNSLTNLELTLSGFPGTWYWPLWGGMPGDVIWDSGAGNVFIVHSNSAGTVLATLQNNYKGTTCNSYSTGGGGNLYFLNSRLFMSQYFLQGDLAASNTIANVGRADAFGTALTTWLHNGDWWGYGLPQYDGFALYALPDVTSILSAVTNGSPGSIAIGANPQRTGTKTPLGLFVRAGPANV